MSLNRASICQAFIDMLKADTTTLYGPNKLLTYITDDPISYDQTRVNNRNPSKLFVWCEDTNTVDVRASNEDIEYILGLKYHAKKAKMINAMNTMDSAYERIRHLTNLQMYAGGGMMSSYYSDANSQIYLIEPVDSSLPAPIKNDNREVVTVMESAISVLVNYWT